LAFHSRLEVDEVSTYCDTGSVLILFAFTKIAYNPCVCLIAFSVVRNVVLRDENNGFHGCSESAYLCPKRFRPYVLVLRVLHEMTVFEEVSCLVNMQGRIGIGGGTFAMPPVVL